MGTKSELQHYLQRARDAMLWKLDGLTEYQKRRPMTATGTNLLGMIKHLALVEYGYHGLTFGGKYPSYFAELTRSCATELNSDMWATADESSDSIVDMYRRAWAHSDATINSLHLESAARVPQWPVEEQEVTLHKVLVHLIAETNRHAGHADIVRELIDESVGLRLGNENMASEDMAWFASYCANVESAARQHQ